MASDQAPLTQVNFRLPEPDARALKHAALDQRVPLSTLLAQLVCDFLRQSGNRANK